MITEAEPLCRWCGCVITNSKKNQKFCSSNHRYLFHKHQLIHPAKLEEKVREIVREELERVGVVTPISS